jgi:hypothetical protein
MSDLRVSVTTKKLLAAAKADMPSAAARAKMWTGVSGAIGGAAGASGVTASVVMSGGASATKLLAVGGLFGGTLAVGLAAALLRIGPAPTPLPHTMISPSAMAQAALASPNQPAIRESISGNPALNPEAASTSTRGANSGPSRTRLARPAANEGSLAREASLVTEARSALGRGDPESAVRAIRAARALPSRQLVPEELAVEEQALRALGQSDEANGIDVQLRLQYPESALAR